MAAEGTIDRRQLALDPGRAGLAARPRRGRARRPVQRAAAAAAPAERRWSSARPPAAAPAEPHRFPCPTCGADLRFEPDRGRLKCQHCGHEEAIPERRGGDPRARPARGRARQPAGRGDARRLRFAQCPSCGAQIEFDADVHARECPFCASPIVTDTGVSRQIKPQAQLPFLLAEDQARAAMNRWLGRLWFAPSDLKRVRPRRAGDAGHLRPLLDLRRRDPTPTTPASAARSTTRPGRSRDRQRPAADRDAAGRAHPLARRRAAGWRATSTTCWCSARRACRSASPTRWRPGTSRRSPPTSRSSSPASAPRATPCRSRRATARRAQIMNAVIEKRRPPRHRRRPAADRRDRDRASGALTFKHVLLPVWLAAYRYRGKSFRFVVNGRTGDGRGRAALLGGRRSPSLIALALIVAGVIAYLQIARELLMRRALSARRPRSSPAPPPAGAAAGADRGDRGRPRRSAASLGGSAGDPRRLPAVARPERRRPRRLPHRPRAARVPRRLERLLRLERLPGHRLALRARRRLRALRPRAAARASRSATPTPLPEAGRALRRQPSAPAKRAEDCTRTWPSRATPRRAAGRRRARGRGRAGAGRAARAGAGRAGCRRSAGWTLRRVPGSSPVALGDGVGNIASLAAFCLAGQPFLAVTFHERPEADSVDARLRLQPGRGHRRRRLRGDRRRRLRRGARRGPAGRAPGREGCRGDAARRLRGRGRPFPEGLQPDDQVSDRRVSRLLIQAPINPETLELWRMEAIWNAYGNHMGASRPLGRVGCPMATSVNAPAQRSDPPGFVWRERGDQRRGAKPPDMAVDSAKLSGSSMTMRPSPIVIRPASCQRRRQRFTNSRLPPTMAAKVPCEFLDIGRAALGRRAAAGKQGLAETRGKIGEGEVGDVRVRLSEPLADYAQHRLGEPPVAFQQRQEVPPLEDQQGAVRGGGRVRRTPPAVEQRDLAEHLSGSELGQKERSAFGRRVGDPDGSGPHQHHRAARIVHDEDRGAGAPRPGARRGDEAVALRRPEQRKEERPAQGAFDLPRGLRHRRPPSSAITWKTKSARERIRRMSPRGEGARGWIRPAGPFLSHRRAQRAARTGSPPS